MTGDGALDWAGEWPARGYDVQVRVERGRTLALVGPNGAGKSTTLDLLAGLLRAPRARLVLDGEPLVDTDAGIDVAAHRRRIALLGQDPLLFPHMTVRANVEFGPRAQGASRSQARARAERLLADVDAHDLAGRRPAALSGGQAARVALARALATTPAALLLDEPFAALDVDVAPQMRRMLTAELDRHDVPAILVTHDLLDVVALADDLAVIEAGRIVEHGTVADVLRAPTSAFAASLAGVDRVHGRITASGELQGDDGLPVRGVPAEEMPTGATAVALWSPSAVALFADRPQGSPRNVWEGVVADLADRGGVVRVGVDVPGAYGTTRIAADLSPAAVADLGIAVGLRIHAAVKAQEITLHPSR